MKTCNICDDIKEEELFCKGKNLCKTCDNNARKKKYAENTEYREKIKAKQREENARIKEESLNVVRIGLQYCNYCDGTKDITFFRINRAKCLECEQQNGRDYRQSNIGKAKSLKWVEENRDRMTQLQANWFQANKARINKKTVERYHNDPVFKLHTNCANRIRSALNKCKTTDEYVGCNGIFYVMWIEFCLERENEGNTLENHGTIWHIDHVVPVATFDLNDKAEQLICFNWRNTMPLNKHLNMSKHDKIVKKQIETHYKNLISFHSKNKLQLPIEFKNLYAKHLIMTGSPLEPITTK